MPRNPLVEKYYNQVKHKYPDLKEEEFHSLINHTFKYFRSRMVDEDLPDIRLKGFGSFQVFATPVLNNIERYKKIIEKKKAKNKLKEYDSVIDRLKMLEDYVKENQALFEKINQRRSKSD